MSYILDALRRAEAERVQGGVPGLHAQGGGTATAAPTRDANPGATWALPVILALALLAALLAWRPWAGVPPALPAVVVPSGGNGEAPTTPAAPERSVPPASASVTAEAPLKPAPTTTVAAPRATSPAKVAAPPTPAVSAQTAKKRATPAASSAVATAPLASAAAASAAKVPSLAELPEDVRRGLPQIAIGGSIYSNNPANRFVIVNGQLFHEGDSLAPGLVLEQIRLKSAVLAFKGYRYGVTF